MTVGTKSLETTEVATVLQYPGSVGIMITVIRMI